MSDDSWSSDPWGTDRPAGWQGQGPTGQAEAPAPSGGQRPGGWRSLPEMLRNRRAARRVLSVLSVGLLLGGAGIFAYPFATDVYTDLFLQPGLEEDFEGPAFRQEYAARGADDGDPVTRLTIPSIGVETMVVEGTSLEALRAGAGHFPNTPLPGKEGNVTIAGHRTTYGKPFHRLDEVGAGSDLKLETPTGTHTYRVVAAPAHADGACPNGACWLTSPDDWSVARPDMDGSLLTLVTCHPKGSAAQRLVLRARLVGSVPQGDTAAREALDGGVTGLGRSAHGVGYTPRAAGPDKDVRRASGRRRCQDR